MNKFFQVAVIQTMIISIAVLVNGFTTPGAVNPQADTEQRQSCTCPPHQAMYIPPGPQGVQGPQGMQGPQGLTGPAGDPGIPGNHGQSGGQGLKGEPGQGSPGSRGEPGQKGDIGMVGLQGQRGYPGKVGPQGSIGLTGTDGVRGHQGDKGDKGEPGTSYTPPPMSAFSAQITHDLSSSQTITFDVKSFDVGNDFDHTNGIFTCRISGVYSFTFTIGKNERDGTEIYLRVNGSNKARIRTDNSDTQGMHSLAVLLVLNQGDEVKLYTSGNFLNLSAANINIFNGYLIHAS